MTGRALPPLKAGRRPAGLALLRWLDDERAPRLCRISGGPGSGKTYLVNWLAKAGTAEGATGHRVVHAVLPARGLTVRAATWLLAEQLFLPAREPEELVAQLAADPRRTVLCVLDVDRAGGPALPAEPGRLVAELLNPLLELEQVRIVADAADGTPQAEAFTAVPDPAVLDLDQPQWTERVRFARWYGVLAAQRSQYGHGDSYPNPGLALFAARTPGGPDGSGRSLVQAWWEEALPEEARPALRALAAAAGPVSVEEWALLPGAGGTAAVRGAAELLPPDGASGEPRWSLRPAELAALVGQPEADAFPEAVSALAQSVPRTAEGVPDFAAAGGRRLTLLLEQAVLAGRAGQLLRDPGFVVHADPVAVTAALGGPPEETSLLAQAWVEAGPALLSAGSPEERAAVLRTRLLGRDEEAALALGRVPGARWRARWAQWGADAVTVAAAPGDGPFAGRVLTADGGGTVRAVDPVSGATEEVALPERAEPKPVGDLAVGPDGSVLVLDETLAANGITALAALPAGPAAGDAEGVVRATGGAEFALHEGPVTALAAVVLPGEVPLLVSGGADGRVRLWGPGEEPAPPVDERPVPVTAVTAQVQPYGGLLTAAAWADGLLRLRLVGGGAPGAPGTDLVLDLRLGSPAWALAAAPSGLLVGLPDGTALLELGG